MLLAHTMCGVDACGLTGMRALLCLRLGLPPSAGRVPWLHSMIADLP